MAILIGTLPKVTSPHEVDILQKKSSERLPKFQINLHSSSGGRGHINIVLQIRKIDYMASSVCMLKIEFKAFMVLKDLFCIFVLLVCDLNMQRN